MKLVQLIDSLEYVRTNCWQHQLVKHIHSQCDEHILIDLSQINAGVVVPECDVILSTIKMRNVDKYLTKIKSSVGRRHINVYDQDVWESFTGTIQGAYERISNTLFAPTFINTSLWWSDYVNSIGYHSIFTRMWIDSDYCNTGTKWDERKVKVGFKGTLHSYRRMALESVRKLGVDVTTTSSSDYSTFLCDLRGMQFFLHIESEEPWFIAGKQIEHKNMCWAKEVEICSQGAFAIRAWEPEMNAYFLDKVPGVLTYRSIEEIPDIISDMIASKDANEISTKSVELIKSYRKDGWFNVYDL